MFKRYNTSFSLDDPRTTLAHRDIIQGKAFLKRLYNEWYATLLDGASSISRCIEIGSGGGFLKDIEQNVTTSDIQQLPGVDLIFNAEHMPFAERALTRIVMLNAFHHLPKPNLFLREAERTLVNGGKIVLIEPANSLFGRFIYKRFHHEPFDECGAREIEPGNPLSNSNQALSYIYFERDAEIFERDFPHLRINSVVYHTPLMYLVSGGLSRSALLPVFLYGLVKRVERLLSPFNRHLGMFCTIEVERV